MRRKKNIEFIGHDQFIVGPDDELPLELPRRIKIADTGKFFDVNIDCMQLPSDTGPRTVRLKEKSQYLTQATGQIFFYVALHALNGRRKISTIVHWIDEFSLFTRAIHEHTKGKISTITFGMFNWYCSQKGASQQKLLRSVIKYWMAQKVPGIDPALQHYLTTSKAPAPRGTIEIQNTTQQERPFSIEQIRKILSSIDDLYITGQFNPQDNLLWRLIVSEAMRPSQIHLLHVGDVTVLRDNAGKTVHTVLKVPIVKQKATPARRFMMDYQVTEAVSHALSEHLSFLEKVLGHEPTSTQPLFSVARSHNHSLIVRKSALNIAHQINRTRKLIADENQDLVDCDLFTRRFKHTKLTHLAMLGAPIEVLARAGFQTSTVSLRHYVNLTDEAFAEYEELLSKQHNEIYAVFKGRIVDRGNATHCDRHHAILDTDLNEDVGSCAGNPCNVFAPIGCYVCPRFEAFNDGPHELVLSFLMERKKHRIGMALSSDSIARDDHLISAVQSVVSALKKRGDQNAA